VVACVLIMMVTLLGTNLIVGFLPAPTTAEINISGKQRMLSQKIARLIEVMAANPGGRRGDEARADLETSLDELRANARSLVEGSEEHGLPGVKDPVLLVSYTAPNGIISEVESFVGLVERVLATEPSLLTPSHPLVHKVRVESGTLLASLDRAVQRHEAVVAQRATRNQWVGHGMSGVEAIVAVLLALFVMGPILKLIQGESEEIDRAHEKLVQQNERREFESTLARALDMSLSESQVLEVTSRALSVIEPEMPSELLLSDNSLAHMRVGAADRTLGPAGCAVAKAFDCPAIRKGQTLSFSSSAALDACPALRERLEHASAVCTPVSFMGEALGVLHQIGPPDIAVDKGLVDKLQTLGIQVGTRLGTVRSFAKVEHQAQRDSLTGLLNRRAFEEEMTALTAVGRSYSLAMADMDHFKRLNDTFGHEAGDRALRTLAKVFEEVCRADDLVARWGGEEFVLVWPDVDAETAAAIVERIRNRLSETCLAQPDHPTFSGSFGLAHSSDGRTWQEVLNHADGCLLQAKAQGRDRLVRHGMVGEITGLAVPEEAAANGAA